MPLRLMWQAQVSLADLIVLAGGRKRWKPRTAPLVIRGGAASARPHDASQEQTDGGMSFAVWSPQAMAFRN